MFMDAADVSPAMHSRLIAFFIIPHLSLHSERTLITGIRPAEAVCRVHFFGKYSIAHRILCLQSDKMYIMSRLSTSCIRRKCKKYKK